jgi:DnaJ-domain-containing protein 1
MNEFSDTEIWLAVALAFGAGYFLVSFLARLMKTEPPAPAGRLNVPSVKPGYDPVALQEERCAQVLGVRPGASAIEIDQAYQHSLAKYPPEKPELGDEFNRLAAEKIQEIEEAYAVLKRSRGSS